MKSTIIRALAIAMLTTSISAFAASEKAEASKNTDCKSTHSEDIVVISFADQPTSGHDESRRSKATRSPKNSSRSSGRTRSGCTTSRVSMEDDARSERKRSF